MRIKLNLLQLTPDRSPAVYWLYVDKSCITSIKQLKEKVQKVLNELRDIELCYDNVPFLDEDDINAINANEEIAVIVKKSKNIHHEPKYTQAESNIIDVDMVPNIANGVLSLYREVIEEPNNDIENSTSSTLLKNPKKRIRKRTHKKNKKNIEPVENDYVGTLSETSIVSSKEVCKMHKRFKLDNAENLQEDSSPSIQSEEEKLEVTREVFRCDSLATPTLNSKEQKSISLPIWKNENQLNIKFHKVPVFVRGQKCTPITSTQNNSYTENENNKSSDSITSEICDMLVVDWKNMSQIKITNITELQISDLLQFKIMSMNECGEPHLSSVITARLDHIYKCTLHIQVLSGIKEFMTINPKFKMDEEEDIGTQREVEFDDLFEIYKLV
ncbi:uncharacterized protein LOC114128600 isoform X1 [Aphis gossypii]|uniref:Coilin n=1 Tax=Aphis gossypii TaxID=80765 RepID=A0A9P0IJ58_APHGO|nr:uncharacterized protein LOC114128600 isoform X1 [Aphis gossypii]CAH1707954.1 unnamed protein product [Aphis gossypii]